MLNELDLSMIRELCAVVDHSVEYIAKIAQATGEYTVVFDELDRMRDNLTNTLTRLGAEEVKQNDRRMGL